MRYAYTASVNLRFWAGERPVNLDTVSRRAQETLARGLADQTRSRSPRGQRERPGGERSVLWGSAHHRRRWCRGCTHGVAVPLRLLHRGSLRSTEPDQESRPPEALLVYVLVSSSGPSPLCDMARNGPHFQTCCTARGRTSRQ